MHGMVWWYILLQGLLQEGYLPTYNSLHALVDELQTTNLVIADEPIRTYGQVIRYYEGQDSTLTWQPEYLEQWQRVIGECAWEGLRPDDYHFTTVKRLVERPHRTTREQVQLELLATDGFLLYLYHLHNGKLNPEVVDPNCHIDVQEGDPSMELGDALLKKDLYSAVEMARPTTFDYRTLLLTHLRLASASDWPAWTIGETIFPDSVDTRIPALYQRLVQGIVPTTTYATVLVDAVKQFQREHGLVPDGIIGQATQQMLALSRSQKMERLCVNMERWRWLPATLSDYHILVNIADFSLDVVRGDSLLAHHTVIVGKPARKTPLFSATMRYLEFNPTWTVPPTILIEDVLPAVRKDISYLSGKNMLVYDHNRQLIDPAQYDWSDPRAKHLRVVQQPGSFNALGVVKFMFPNPYFIYLHDTPNKELFARSSRAFSSGCIRVSDPLELAELLLQPQGWDSVAVQKAVDSLETQQVILQEKPEVYVLYFTAWQGQPGITYFRHDHYGLDDAIASALQEPAVY